MIKSSTENQHTHFISNIFFFENRAVCEIMWKNTVEPGRPHDNMAHAHCLLDIKIKNTHCQNLQKLCFSTATMVPRTRLNITSYVHFLSCLISPKRFVRRLRTNVCQCCRSIVILKKLCNIFGFIHWAHLFLNTST